MNSKKSTKKILSLLLSYLHREEIECFDRPYFDLHSPLHPGRGYKTRSPHMYALKSPLLVKTRHTVIEFHRDGCKILIRGNAIPQLDASDPRWIGNVGRYPDRCARTIRNDQNILGYID